MLDKSDLVRDTIRMFLSEVQRFEIDNKDIEVPEEVIVEVPNLVDRRVE